MVEIFYAFDYGDGSIHEVKLTREEFLEMKKEGYAIFESKEQAELFATGEEEFDISEYMNQSLKEWIEG